jgi:predicted permease
MEPGIRDMVAWRMVTPGYFSALRIPISKGRAFQDQDRTSSENLIILSDSLARRMFPGENPLGQRIKLDPWFTVVGVARDVRNNGLTAQADPEFYVVRKHSTDDPSWRSTSARRATLLVRSSLGARVVSEWIRSETAQMDATLPVQIVPMTQRVGRLSQRPRFNAVLLGLFAAMGVLLAAIGLYGVVSCLVIERTQEIGVRMALGATPSRIAQMMLTHTARWTAAGAAAGLLGAWLATGWLTSLLFQVSARDPRMLAAAVALLLTVALVAAWLPSRRAARVDPMSALRQE